MLENSGDTARGEDGGRGDVEEDEEDEEVKIIGSQKRCERCEEVGSPRCDTD